MQKLVFLTHDVTPEQWAAFSTAADIPPDAQTGTPTPTNLYIPIHSPSQQTLQPKHHIATTLKSHFHSATWQDVKKTFKSMSSLHTRCIHPAVFLILDQQSVHDGKVIILHEGMARWFTPNGEYADETMGMRGDLEERTVWKKYRVPFERAWSVQCAVEGFCGMEVAERYFEKDVMGD